MRGVGGRGGGDGARDGAVFLPFALGVGFDVASEGVLPPTFSLMDGRGAGVACVGGSAGRGVGGARDDAALAGADGMAARGCAARSAASRVLLIRTHSV